MKAFYLLFISLFLLILSCRKEETFSNDPSKMLEISVDTVFFDTVFTTIGSTTQRVKIFNRNKQALRISEIKLMGGALSSYQLNVNGISGSSFANLELPGNDSINLFIKVSIDPDSQKLPFIVADSITFLTNGNHQQIQLQAFGQNAHIFKNKEIDENTSWDKEMPYLIYGKLELKAGKILKILAGSRIYFHKDAVLTVHGTLQIEGSVDDSVTISGDRMERIYADEPGQWQGIRFSETSKDNRINYANIRNAITGLQAERSAESNLPKLLLTNSVLRNMEIAGIAAYNTSISGFNNIISNCGKHLIYCTGGGTYNFKQNTFSNLNYYFSRITPSVYLNDELNESGTAALKLSLINNIIWGSLADELIVEKKGNQLNQTIRNNLIKSRDRNLEGWGNLVNQDPLFRNARNNEFELLNNSPAANKGENLSSDPDFSAWLMKDRNGKERLFPSELGSYEIF